MDIPHLRYFLALAETLNYTTAARSCYISRQGMRQAIQSMEKEYGLPLIINDHNHLSLTPAGRLLQSHGKAILSDYDRMDREMRRYAARTEVMQIGISRSLVPFYAPELVHHLENYAKQYPNHSCQIQILSADDILQKLETGELDAGLIVELSDGSLFPELPWTRTVLRRDTMTLLMAASHSLARKTELTLVDLSGYTVLLMSDPEVCFAPFYQALQSQQIPVNFEIVPDYYEVGYQILNKNVLAIDREKAAEPAPSRLDCNQNLENGRFVLNCSLLIPEENTVKLSALQQSLVHFAAKQA